MNRAPNEASFLIVGTCRNVEGTIESDLARIRSAIPSENVSFLVVESDSSDGTVSTLLKLKQKVKNFRYFTEGALIHRMNERVERISFCRNKYLKDIKENPLYRDIDYVIVADLDGLNSNITKEYFLTCWNRVDWNVCCANQLNSYYDLYALRHELWNPCDCFMQRDFICLYSNPRNKTHTKLEESIILSKVIKIPEEAPWIEVDSAFGGLAIYKRDTIILGSYNHLDSYGRLACEHVQLHSDIKKSGGRIFINPSFINAIETEHTKNIFISKFWRRQLRSIDKRLHFLKHFLRKR